MMSSGDHFLSIMLAFMVMHFALAATVLMTTAAERATERWKAQLEGRVIEQPVGGLGDIVMVASVAEARERNVLKSVRPFESFMPNGVVWVDGSESAVDAVICAPDFGQPYNIWIHWGWSTPKAPLRSKAPTRPKSQGCGWSVTASGPVRHPPH